MKSSISDSLDVGNTDCLGTGPGVIHVDNYTPGYSSNMGRPRLQGNSRKLLLAIPFFLCCSNLIFFLPSFEYIGYLDQSIFNDYIHYNSDCVC